MRAFWILLGGCSLYFGGDPSAPPSMPVPIVEQVTEPPGVNCPLGGTATETGLDTNGDGALEPDEVTTTSYACAPETLFDQVVTVTAGGCPTNGWTIAIGYDLNDSATLDADEIVRTEHVCGNQPTLVREAAEPAGANCTFGGEAIDIGVDANGDGILDAAEVTSTTFACAPNATIDGDVTVTTRADLVALVGVRTITGTLTIASPVIDVVRLPALDSAGSIATTGVITFLLPHLTSVGAMTIRDPALVVVRLPQLVTATAFRRVHSAGWPRAADADVGVDHVGAVRERAGHDPGLVAAGVSERQHRDRDLAGGSTRAAGDDVRQLVARLRVVHVGVVAGDD